MTDDEWISDHEWIGSSREWNGETWVNFPDAVVEMRDRLDLSLGSAQRTLRQLCSSGDVRAIREQSEEEEPTLIAPTEWSAAEVDYHSWVYVSGDDLRYWSDKQKPTEANAKGRTSKRR
jgi:hypothetical protein